MFVVLRVYALVHGCHLLAHGESILISKGARTMRLSMGHAPYVRDIVEEFETYFGAVESEPGPDGTDVVDCSGRREHLLEGWNLFPILLPGLPEPMVTVRQYVALTAMSSGDNVIDLGAYAGVTAMAFQEVVGPSGRVVAVEADPENAACAHVNIGHYIKRRGYGPTLINAAVWSASGSVDFVAEGTLGSAVAQLLPRSHAIPVSVRTLTLSELVVIASMERVDIIKADIEGAEFKAFSDASFFATRHPVLIFEPVGTTVHETQLEAIETLLAGYGYTFEVVRQHGSRLPLVVCRHPTSTVC